MRHPLHNTWRRKHHEVDLDFSENRLDSLEKDVKSDEENKDELFSSNSQSKPQASNTFLPWRKTLSTVQRHLNLLTIIETSLIITSIIRKKFILVLNVKYNRNG
jgi:hypothetical protein